MSDPRHPLVGTWTLTFPDEPDAGPSLNSFTTDGLVFQASPRRLGQGVWEGSGERLARMNLMVLVPGEDADPYTVRVRAILEVDPTGDVFTGTFTNESVRANGTSRGESVPLEVIGTRVRIEEPTLLPSTP